MKRTLHFPTVQQNAIAQDWRKLVGPGNQFPVTTDKVLGFWPRRQH